MKIGFFGILGLLLVTLKLTEVITWSWWLVLLPFYGGLIVVVIGILVVAGLQVRSDMKRK